MDTNPNCDDHNQPFEEGFNWSRRRDRGTDELIGLCRGVLADGVLVHEEAEFIYDWLQRNEPVRLTLAGRELYTAIEQALKGGQLDHDGEDHLVSMMLGIIGGTPQQTKDNSYSTTIPLDHPPPLVEVLGRSFCFTGKFNFGSRLECRSCIMSSGGLIHNSPKRDTSYLVIGLIGSRDWIHSSSGRKIEHAIELRDQGTGIRIISETHWVASIEK